MILIFFKHIHTFGKVWMSSKLFAGDCGRMGEFLPFCLEKRNDGRITCKVGGCEVWEMLWNARTTFWEIDKWNETEKWNGSVKWINETGSCLVDELYVDFSFDFMCQFLPPSLRLLRMVLGDFLGSRRKPSERQHVISKCEDVGRINRHSYAIYVYGSTGTIEHHLLHIICFTKIL